MSARAMTRTETRRVLAMLRTATGEVAGLRVYVEHNRRRAAAHRWILTYTSPLRAGLSVGVEPGRGEVWLKYGPTMDGDAALWEHMRPAIDAVREYLSTLGWTRTPGNGPRETWLKGAMAREIGGAR